MKTPDPFDEPEEFELFLDRLHEGLPRPKQLPPDLAKLVSEIAAHVIVRKVHNPNLALYMLDRFEALHTVTGGMGLVIEARDPQLDRKVAIKMWVQSGPEAQAALLAEAKTLAKLSHPNVVAVHETGTWGERVYFVMDWIEGVDGHEWMATPRPWQEVLDVFVEAGLGLAAAHQAGIQHRDFKPANMLIGDDDRVVVADFGVADSLRALESDEPGKIVGTPSYMAPERLRGGRGDARSDQFSFCVAMWKALHGLRPFAGEMREELLDSIGQGIPRHGERARQVPRWLRLIVRKGLAEQPDERHRDMQELLKALLDGPAGGGGAVDGESAGEALSGAPGPAGSLGAAELSALADEIVKRLQSQPAAAEHDEGSLELVGDRASPRPSQQGLLALVGIISVMVGAILTLSIVLMLREPTQATAEKPLSEVIHEYLAADGCTEAVAVWRKQPPGGLSDEDSLAIARACLERGMEIDSTDAKLASEAAEMAREVASFVAINGSDSRAKQAGGQLLLEVNEFNRSRPSARRD